MSNAPVLPSDMGSSTTLVPMGSDAPTTAGSVPGSASVDPTGTTTGVPTSPTSGTSDPTQPSATTTDPTQPPGADACTGSEILAPKRLVRLSFNQIVNSLRVLFDTEFAGEVAATYELPSALERTFPPLNNPREGSVIIDAQWQTSDAIAQAASEHVQSNFGALSACEEVTSECALQFADGFAERVFRRPLSGEEQTALHVVFDAALEVGATPDVAAQHMVYAALSAPQFLYRTEFGHDAFAEGPLEPYETASMLSYFVTDGPPDAELLQAAAEGALTTKEQLGTHVDRLLQTEAARENLQAAIYSYFGISKLGTIVIDPEVAPLFTEGLRSSMMHETELFINDTLWNGTVTDLLTSSQSYVNEGLAELYGIDYPPSGSTPDADGFALATLPEERSGILTQPGYLTTRSSPNKPSVVRRGLLVNASLLCATNPAFPEDQAEAIEQISEALADASEREKAAVRSGSPDCSSCHTLFDPYGLALDNFDVIGAYREADPQGRAIDASVTLPATAGGAMVTSPRQMAAELVKGGAFTTCVSKNLLGYALAEGSTISADSCATKAVATAFESSDKRFGSLVKEVVLSTTFTTRSAGEQQ